MLFYFLFSFSNILKVIVLGKFHSVLKLYLMGSYNFVKVVCVVLTLDIIVFDRNHF